ncbi:MAG: DUF4129 domain-containing protein [Stellaceae bacterium]
MAASPRQHLTTAVTLRFTVAAGLILAVAGTLPRYRSVILDALPRHLVVALPGWLVLAIVIPFAVATLLLLAMAMPRPRRRRTQDDEDFEEYHEPTKMRGALLLLVPPVVLSLALVAAMIWWAPSHGAAAGHIVGRLGAATPGPFTPATRPLGGGIQSPAASALLGGLALLVAVAALLGALWLHFAARGWRGRPRGQSQTDSAIRQAVAEGLAALASEREPRRAIIRCYGRFEALLAGRHLPRARWQTALEFMRIALARAALPRDSVAALTDLFERARFGRAAMDDGDRAAALRSLAAIEAALDRQGSHGKSA